MTKRFRFKEMAMSAFTRQATVARAGIIGGQRGNILILTALSMTMLLSIAALSIDASFLYDRRSRIYAAADAAAKIGAAEVHHDTSVSYSALVAVANDQVTAHGLTPGACGSTTTGTTAVCIYHPPEAWPGATHVGDLNYVEARLSEPNATFFAKVL